MDDTEKRKRARIRAAYRRLGTSTPACAICGESNPFCLELHEPGGRKYNKMRMIVCRNCHRKLGDDAHDHFRPAWSPPDELEMVGLALLGEADLFARLSEKRRADAQILRKRALKDIVPPEDGEDHE